MPTIDIRIRYPKLMTRIIVALLNLEQVKKMRDNQASFRSEREREEREMIKGNSR